MVKDNDFWFPFLLVGMWALIAVIAAGTFFSIGYDMGRDAVEVTYDQN